jgi:hypothetical protein
MLCKWRLEQLADPLFGEFSICSGFRQPHFLNLLGMLACRANPIDDGPFFVPFSTRQAADTTILRDQGQGVNDLIFGCAAAIEG